MLLFGIVIAEAMISKSRLCIEVLPLVQEGPHFALLYTHTPIDVQLTLPETLTHLIIRLYGNAEVVRDDGVVSIAYEFC